ncbi:C2 calcium/lipid-binding plant phosphoribosyltransferase family protein [Actinidia rufa]|uniref:C2 calcium/lipid-binding plant phosphoribosyltransferase family protein n=1 Tax=Actinidia rufa TaxID=165716 RepID=A0A7J0DXP2_9ERIC|nr:C2 calcium/lipid-binding plant phosphoribosyltransferase family protein [Actinidia rufa]
MQAVELVKRLWDQVLLLDDSKISEFIRTPSRLLFTAAELGIVEFVTVLIHSYPDLIWKVDDQSRSIFHVAVAHRQKNIFNLIYEIGALKDLISAYKDENNVNMLHLAAKLAPLNRLKTDSGAALQLRRELYWFKEVEKIVQPLYTEMKDSEGRTPHILFTEEHKGLVREGEKWMKDTASSCMVVATLIATVIFAAAFTVPGGNNNDTGRPIAISSGNHNVTDRPIAISSFLVFAISDALAFFSSVTSILMFLSILTSRYAEEDFLESLPNRLIIGLATLFISIATMMISFCAALSIVLDKSVPWVSVPMAVVACIPVTLFAFLQFPLLVDMYICSVYVNIEKLKCILYARCMDYLRINNKKSKQDTSVVQGHFQAPLISVWTSVQGSNHEKTAHSYPKDGFSTIKSVTRENKKVKNKRECLTLVLEKSVHYLPKGEKSVAFIGTVAARRCTGHPVPELSCRGNQLDLKQEKRRMELVVEVVDVHDLVPKDGQGSDSPFIEVDFENQLSRNRTVQKSQPHLESKTSLPFRQNQNYHHQSIQVSVDNERRPIPGRNFLGRLKEAIKEPRQVKAETTQYVDKHQVQQQPGLFVAKRPEGVIFTMHHQVNNPQANPNNQQEDYELKDTNPQLGEWWRIWRKGLDEWRELGNYKGRTTHFEKKMNPEWNQVFAFSKECIQSSVPEVFVKDKEMMGRNDYIGKVIFDLNEVPTQVPPDSPLAPQWYRFEDQRGGKVKEDIMVAVWMGT